MRSSESGSVLSAGANLSSERRSIRSIHPLGMRVVVRVRKEESRTDSGLYLPEGSKQATQDSLIAEVIEVASAIEIANSGEEEEVNVSGVPAGALVLLPREAGIRVPWDEDLRIVETKQILALISEEDVY
ncbi:MAG TPA: co-chaperone GroES family protein [Oligoflexia bacterium]|nr:co-chaperone GroES family protein [Oligoflexia bacterium]HMP49654.1 co-chaperone GroES family protein [Oligoflexia bacterium]